MNSLVFQVDLFSARGVLPRDIQEVLARHKDIVYSSRTRHNTDVYKQMNNLKTDLYKALMKIPQDQLSDEERAKRDSLMHLPEITILQMIYQQKAYEGDSKDHEFSATSMHEHWQSGIGRYPPNLEAAGLAGVAGSRHGYRRSRCAPREGLLTLGRASGWKSVYRTGRSRTCHRENRRWAHCFLLLSFAA